MKKAKKLEELIGHARELSEVKDRTPEQEADLVETMKKARDAHAAFVRDRSLDEFQRSISDDVSPRETAKSNDVFLGFTGFGGRMAAYAEREGWSKAVEAWKTKQRDARWGFDVHYKADLDNSVSETGAGARTLAGDDPGNQYAGSVAPFYYPGIVEPPTRPPLIADLFAQGSTDSNLVRLVKETFTSADAANTPGGAGAAATAEGAAYGAVKLEVSPVDWPVRDITALLPVTEDILMDIPAMSSYLSMRLSKFVQLAEEDELVQGLGTGNHLEGLLHLAGVTTLAQGSQDIDSAVIDLNAKVYQNSFMDPEWIAMSPATWSTYIRLRTNLNGGFGQFLAGPPSLAAVRQMWGLPITVSPVIPDNKVIVGCRAAGMIFRHGGLRVESSTGYGTFFGEGLVAIRGKVRTAFAIFRPQAIGILTLGSSSTFGS